MPPGLGIGGWVIARMAVFPVRSHTFHDFPGLGDFEVKGGDTGLLAFVGEVGARPAKGTGYFHWGPPSEAALAGSTVGLAKTHPRRRYLNRLKREPSDRLQEGESDS